MEKLDRYNIMRFMYGVYHSHRISYKAICRQQNASWRVMRCHALPYIAKHVN